MTTIKFKVSKVATMCDIGISKASVKEQAERGQWYQGVDATDGSATRSVVKEWTQWMDQRQGQRKDTIRVRIRPITKEWRLLWTQHGLTKFLPGTAAAPHPKSQTQNPCLCCLGGEEMPAKVVILAQFDHGYYIRGTLKRLTDVVDWLKAQWIRFGHGYYIHGTLKRLMGVLAWLMAWWIRFEHGYYIRETLKRLTDVVAWLKAWWICVSVKQVTDQKSMPLLPRWGGKVVILAQFGHGYYISGTSKCLTGFMD
ncbi:hypothetical protein C8R44DRAFT_747836 [Mycena epipterygia]|nr:hypothetical protein C8R44DRAFT_747836 [Mycena epipterygia]